MRIQEQIKSAFPKDVALVIVDKDAVLHGQKSVSVVVHLKNGLYVEGTFVKEARAGFGGVVFSQQRDVAALMILKIRAALNGTAEEVIKVTRAEVSPEYL